MSASSAHVLWSGRPAQGLAWRPQDLGYTIIFSLVGLIGLVMSLRDEKWFFSALLILFLAYLLVGRFYHDAALRKTISYRLTTQGLEVWRDGEHLPHCVVELHRLTKLRAQFITRSGRGTAELPPGGWADRPEWVNRWDRMVPAMYPCRRLELVDDLLATLEIIRTEASRARFGHERPPVA
jgi:hypothetical protein